MSAARTLLGRVVVRPGDLVDLTPATAPRAPYLDVTSGAGTLAALHRMER